MRLTVPKMPRELKLGDVIADGSKKGCKVEEVAHYVRGCRNTHVNSKDCYTWSIPVRVFAD